MPITGDSKINQVILFSRKPGGKYKYPNLRVNESNIATIRKTISEARKIAVFTFLGNDVILLIIIIITLYYLPEKNKLLSTSVNTKAF